MVLSHLFILFHAVSSDLHLRLIVRRDSNAVHLLDEKFVSFDGFTSVYIID